MKNQLAYKVLTVICYGLIALLPWSCADHRIPPTNTDLLTGCTAGWKPAGLTIMGTNLYLVPDCYRMIFRSDGTLVMDRARCSGQDMSPLSLGQWSASATALDLPLIPNLYEIPGIHFIDEISSTRLRFYFRTKPDDIEETWVCE